MLEYRTYYAVVKLTLCLNNVVNHEVKNKINVEYSSETLKNWRTSSQYMIDGIIITDDKVYPRDDKDVKNPKHAVAFKMVLEDQKEIAKVLGVTWTTSKHGLKKPVIDIEEVFDASIV